MESIVAIVYLPSALHSIVYKQCQMEDIVAICIMLGSLHVYSIVHCLDHACAVGGCMYMYIALENTDKQQGNNKLLVIGQIIMKEIIT